MSNKDRIPSESIQYAVRCDICGKGPVASVNRPHSLHKTKRVVRPNLQKYNGLIVCTRCLRTHSKKGDL